MKKTHNYSYVFSNISHYDEQNAGSINSNNVSCCSRMYFYFLFVISSCGGGQKMAPHVNKMVTTKMVPMRATVTTNTIVPIRNNKSLW